MIALPPGVDAEYVLDVKGEYVYILLDSLSNATPIYVGKSRSVFSRVTQHLNGGWKSIASRARRRGFEPRYVQILKCRDAEVKDTLERELIFELRPLLNRQLGDIRPHVGRTGKIHLDE